MKDTIHIKESDLDKEPIHERGWQEFKKSGLLFLVNQFLHIFGWVLVYQYLDNNKYNDKSEPSNVFVARTSYRGFGDEVQDRGYKHISKYMKEHGEELYDEVIEDE